MNVDLISDYTTSITLSVTPMTDATGYQWHTSASGNSPVVGATGTTYSVAISPNTPQTFYVEAMIGPCPSLTRVPLTASIYPQPVLSASNKGEVLMGNPVTMACTNTIYTEYKWLNSSGTVVSTSSTLTTAIKDLYRLQVKKGVATYLTGGIPVWGRNYVKVTDVYIENVPSKTVVDALPIGNKSVIVDYVDGVGRPIQTLNVQASPSGLDIVQPVAYNKFGYEVKKYLPYSSGVGGAYHPNALTDVNNLSSDEQTLYRAGEQYQFYQSSAKVETSQYPYSQTNLESSPLARMTAQGAPGDALRSHWWIQFEYDLSNANEVLIWTYVPAIGSTPEILTHRKPGSSELNFYAPFTLRKNITKDEHNHVVIEYLDRGGRTVLKRVQAVEGIDLPINDTNYASTYYVYDDLGNLVVVLPPEAVKIIMSSN
jgi:hypothetical protein